MNSLFTEKEITPLIRSISYRQDIILQSIIHLYLPAGKIQLDPCYNKGRFYESGIVPEPDYIYDITPLYAKVKYADCCKLPLDNNSIDSVIFDPPFITYPGKNLYKPLRRYGAFRTYGDLKKMYKASLKEFFRILKTNGILIVKCQDGTFGPDITFTHIDAVVLPCRVIRFKELDLFILLSNQRIENRNGNQRHSRKYHSYFIVFKKGKINAKI